MSDAQLAVVALAAPVRLPADDGGGAARGGGRTLAAKGDAAHRQPKIRDGLAGLLGAAAAARPVREDLEALVAGCDHLIIPTTPDALALDALVQTVGALEALGATNYRVLLTIVPPAPSRDGDEARASLAAQHIPVFTTAIPRLAAFAKAALAGIVVSDVAGDPRARRAWEAYARVGKELS